MSILAGIKLTSDLVEVSNRNLAKAEAEGAIELPTNLFDVDLLGAIKNRDVFHPSK